MSYNIALVGNPNCGKTTLFNSLTGTHQKVGNWTGVTTERKIGEYKKDKSVKIIDLPGLYSLSASAVDEREAFNFLTKNKPDAIINVIDGTNLERNLYLTLELCSLGLPLVIAVNMCDELEKNSLKFNGEKLSQTFGVPVILVSALKNKNIDKLIKMALNNAKKPQIEGYKSHISKGIAEEKYKFIENLSSKVIVRKQTRAEHITQKVDTILLNRFAGIPIFFAVMFTVYFLSMKIGGFLGGYLTLGFDNLSEICAIKLNALGVSEWIVSLISDAIIGSLGGVTSFLPQILILFALMAIIEESGYAARIAFLMDRFFRIFGLGGKSLLPMIVSCGCTVTGIMTTRTIERASERRMTIFLSPFMPCGAKTAVFAWFASVFFDGSAFVAASMYFLGIICVGVFGAILKNFKPFRENDGDFIMEIPTLRIPSIKDVFFVLVEKVKEFITKAGLIVFCVSVFLWLLKSVGTSGYVAGDIEKSFLFDIGSLLKYIFYPLGVSGWEASVALIAGSFAKEAIVETLNLIATDVNTIFANTYSAYAFMAFVLLSPPCVASLAAAKQELGGLRWFVFMIVFQILSAYSVAIIINAIGNIITYHKGLLLSLILAIIITLAIVFAIKKIKNTKCCVCKGCKGGRKCQKVERFTI